MKKKRILLIATGGTIASKSTLKGLAPLMSTDEILRYVPLIRELCELECIQIMNVDSTNMTPKHWLIIARCIEDCYIRYDGFVVLHGTDTMSYTAAALSYLIQDSYKPIVLTGSQRPIEREITDAVTNMTDSFRYVCDKDSFGVSIVFDGKVILGTRARKTRTKSFNAFTSMDYPELAFIRDDRMVRYMKEKLPKEPVFYRTLNDRVFLLKLLPGMSPHILQYLQEDYDAVIIESFGVGGVPAFENNDFEDAIHDWIQSGKHIVMTTQVPHEGSDLGIYSVGQKYKHHYKVIESYDMTLEAAVTKLMWILAQTKDRQEVERLFYKTIAHDMLLYK
jgi:L-asparaginase